MTFPRSADLERHHKTVHLNNGVRPYECLDLGCPANVRSWTTMRGLRLHEKNWHGPHSCSVPGCSRRDPFGFSSDADLEVHQLEHSGGSNLDQHGDEHRRRERKKGRSGKSAVTSDGTQKIRLFSSKVSTDLLILIFQKKIIVLLLRTTIKEAHNRCSKPARNRKTIPVRNPPTRHCINQSIQHHPVGTSLRPPLSSALPMMSSLISVSTSPLPCFMD